MSACTCPPNGASSTCRLHGDAQHRAEPSIVRAERFTATRNFNGQAIETQCVRAVDHALVEMQRDAISGRCERLETVLRALTTNQHLDLGDLVYQVREREGLGWDGPSVKAWSDAVTKAQELLK